MTSLDNYKYIFKNNLKMNILLIIIFIMGLIYIYERDSKFTIATTVLEIRSNLKLTEIHKTYSTDFLDNLLNKYLGEVKNILPDKSARYKHDDVYINIYHETYKTFLLERIQVHDQIQIPLNQRGIIDDLSNLILDKEEFNLILNKDENLKDLINKNTLAVYPSYKEKGISLFNAFHTKIMTVGVERDVIKFTSIGKYKVSEMVNLYAKQYADLFIYYNLDKYDINPTERKDLDKFIKDIFYHNLNKFEDQNLFLSNLSYYIILTIIYLLFIITCNYVYSFRYLIKKNKRLKK
jgi:hypothetical protein